MTDDFVWFKHAYQSLIKIRMVEGRINFPCPWSLKGNMPLIWQRPYGVIPGAVRIIFISITILETLPLTITKTCLYNVDPLKPHFYIVELGFTGVYIILLISVEKHRLLYSLEPPRWGGSKEYPQSMFWAEIWKISEFLYENFHFLAVKFSVY